ncbi:MAG: hypothetical protein ACTSUF_11480 [Candidatus Heimdallarchaeaceae archaeon]
MQLSLEQILVPCNPSDFIGQYERINEFSDIVANFRKGKTNNLLLILGDNGTGKSSLLYKLADSTAGRRDLTHVFNLEPEPEQLKNFLSIWKNKIDELSPKWRSTFGRKEFGADIPPLSSHIKLQEGETITDFYVKKFLHDLDKLNQKLIETKTFLYFFIDNYQLFKYANLPEMYPIIATIIKEFRERNYQIFIVLAFHERYLFEFDYNKFLTEANHIFRTAPLSVADAEIYLRRKYPKHINKGITKVIDYSRRTFFDLNLGTAYIINEIGLEAFIERDIGKLFGVTEEEQKVLDEIATYNENLIPISQLLTYVSPAAVESLKQKGLLWVGSTYCRFVQESLFDSVRFHERLYSPLSVISVKLDTLKSDVSAGIAPRKFHIDEIVSLSKKIHSDLGILLVSAKLQDIVAQCITNNLEHKASEFALINASLFELIGDYEQAGEICENVARELEEKDYYLAGKLYLQAAEYFTSAASEQKAKRAYTRAADQFEKKALSLSSEKEEYAIRAYLKWVLESYRHVGDKNSFERIREKAIKLFPEGSVHRDFFEQIKYEVQVRSTPAIVAEEPAKEEKHEKLSIEDLEKELEF